VQAIRYDYGTRIHYVPVLRAHARLKLGLHETEVPCSGTEHEDGRPGPGLPIRSPEPESGPGLPNNTHRVSLNHSEYSVPDQCGSVLSVFGATRVPSRDSVPFYWAGATSGPLAAPQLKR
jgi:hypothetical protein